MKLTKPQEEAINNAYHSGGPQLGWRLDKAVSKLVLNGLKRKNLCDALGYLTKDGVNVKASLLGRLSGLTREQVIKAFTLSEELVGALRQCFEDNWGIQRLAWYTPPSIIKALSERGLLAQDSSGLHACDLNPIGVFVYRSLMLTGR